MHKVLPMSREKGEDYVLGYMCGIDFTCELGANSAGNRVYPSVESALSQCPCTEGDDEYKCAIIEVKIEAIQVAVEGYY